MNDIEHPCRLYLVVPHDAGPRIAADFEKALNAGDVACALLLADASGKVDRVLAEQLASAADAQEIAFLVENDIDAAAELEVDGVHIAADEALYQRARDTLGANAIVGVECPPERHIALTLAEAGADYVAFRQSPDRKDGAGAKLIEILSWWAEVVEVPVVAWRADSLEEARTFARAGADFVAIGDAVWRHDAKPGDAIRSLTAALMEGRAAV